MYVRESRSVFRIVKLKVIVMGWNILFLMFVKVMIGMKIIRMMKILKMVEWNSLVEVFMIILFICCWFSCLLM